MTKIQIASDLHLEFHRDGGRSLVESFDPTGVDVLILAGDIGTWTCLDYGLSAFAEKYRNVVFVPGNHEAYGISPAQLEVIRKRHHKVTANLHWLEEGTVTILGQRFVGTTLWFPDTEDARRNKRWLNDFSVIKNFVPWVYEKNTKAIKFLVEEVREGDVVVTHHLPVEESIAPEYKGSPYNAFFLCDVKPIVEERGAKLWVHGHSHSSADYILGSTRVVCNPMGYPHEMNPKFNDKLVVEVGT